MRKYNGLTKKVKKINGKANRVWEFEFDLLKTVFYVKDDEDVLASDDEVI
jgi:hypothetical protein